MQNGAMECIFTPNYMFPTFPLGDQLLKNIVSNVFVVVREIHSFKSVFSKTSKVSGSNIFLPFKPLPISMKLKGNA